MEKMEAPAPLNDNADLEAALLCLLMQITCAGYRDPHGQPLESNLAYLDAMALLRLRGTIGVSAGVPS